MALTFYYWLIKFLVDGSFPIPVIKAVDSPSSYWVALGYVSWGEYPMNFAAVLNQEEIYRLILAKGGNFDLQVHRSLYIFVLWQYWYTGHKWLHCDPHHGGVRQHQHVRHGRRVRCRHQHWEQPGIDSSHHCSISRQVRVLKRGQIFGEYLETLCRMDMFFHIASIERDIYWQLGNVTCSAYPLK